MIANGRFSVMFWGVKLLGRTWLEFAVFFFFFFWSLSLSFSFQSADCASNEIAKEMYFESIWFHMLLIFELLVSEMSSRRQNRLYR